jgi:hypothetical protein
MINLQDFISETLKQIIDGVKTAQEHAAEAEAYINPRGAVPASSGSVDGGYIARSLSSLGDVVIQSISFDVAVTATEGTGTKGGIGIVVGPVALGSQGKSDTINSSVSRIKFSVPIVLPTQKLP